MPSPYVYECAGCCKSFIAPRRARAERSFCTRECYQKFTIVHHDRECLVCGKVFSPRKGPRSVPRKGDPSIYCSAKCYRARPSKHASLDKVCPVCGKDYVFTLTDTGGTRSCSPSCTPAGTKYVDCERCGKRFRGFRGNGRKPRRYCSEECHRPPMILTCRNCERQFRECPGETGRQFCSIACYRSFVGETKLEARIRVALEILGVPFEQEFAAGRWSIDFAVVGHKLAIEADGDYWHKLSADRDKRRDAQLTREGWRIVRLAESEVNGARDLPQLILDRVREATGLGRRALASIGPAESAARLTGQAALSRPFRMRASRGPIAGQLALWGG